MNPILPIHKITLRAITIVYLLIFIGGLSSSGYLLVDTVSLKPIPLIGLLKYSLLCVLFLVLLINAVKALTLHPEHVSRLSVSTRNFKWLSSIAAVLCITAWLGLFNLTSKSEIVITPLQIGVLVVLTIFCFWSDGLLQAVHTDADDHNDDLIADQEQQ